MGDATPPAAARSDSRDTVTAETGRLGRAFDFDPAVTVEVTLELTVLGHALALRWLSCARNALLRRHPLYSGQRLLGTRWKGGSDGIGINHRGCVGRRREKALVLRCLRRPDHCSARTRRVTNRLTCCSTDVVRSMDLAVRRGTERFAREIHDRSGQSRDSGGPGATAGRDDSSPATESWRFWCAGCGM